MIKYTVIVEVDIEADKTTSEQIDLAIGDVGLNGLGAWFEYNFADVSASIGSVLIKERP